MELVLERAGGTARDLGRYIGSRREIRSYPALPFDVEYRRQPAETDSGVPAHLGIERDGDFGRIVHLQSSAHVTPASKNVDLAFQ